MRRWQHDRILRLLGESQELFTQGIGGLQYRACAIINPQPTQHWEMLLRISQVLTEVVCTQVGLFHLRSRIALRGNERCAQGDQHIYFTLETLWCLGERFEKRESLKQLC